MYACLSQNPLIFNLLLDTGVDPCAVNDQGMSVIHLLSFLGSSESIQRLLSSISNKQIVDELVNKSDVENRTALFYACAEGHSETALVLLEFGGDPYHVNDELETCLHWTLSSSVILFRHIELFHKILELTDFREIRDARKRSLRDLAIEKNSRAICFLLELFLYPTESEEKNGNRQIFSLRQISILKLKNSVSFRRDQIHRKQISFLRRAIEQVFRFDQNETERNPMEKLARTIYSDPKKLKEILDFPSVKSNPFVELDLKFCVESNSIVLRTDSQIITDDLD